MGVVGITWVRSGEAGVRYLTSGFNCKHEPTSYYLEGTAHGEPQAVWLGSAVDRLGFEVGQEVTTEDALIVFAHGCDPVEFKIAMAQVEETIRAQGLTQDEADDLRRAVVDQTRLGRAPYRFKTPEEKLEAWLRQETRRSGGIAPDPERVAAQKERFDAGKVREARPYVDLTFSAQKSVSVFHAALLSAGRVEDAAKLMSAFHAAIDDALKYAEKEAGYTRAGRHSAGGNNRPTTGQYVDAGGFVAARWDHHTSREGDPQLHAHVTIRNNTPWLNPQTRQVEWLALDGAALHKAQRGIAAVFERSLEERITAELMAEFKLRPDGKSREIVGISEEMLAAFSTRRGQIDARLAQYVATFKANNNGAEPSKYQLYRLSQAATLATRKGKDDELSLTDLVDKWSVAARVRVDQELAEVLRAVEAEAVSIRLNGHEGITSLDLAQRPELREEVIRAALERVQSERANFTREDVLFAIQKELPLLRMNGEASAPLLESLANQAVAMDGVIQTDGFELFPAPAELCRASDGRNMYRPHYGKVYSTAEQMTHEQMLVAQARNTEVCARVGAELVEARIAEHGLVAGQADAVRGVLTDGRQVSVIVGPAGAGKTTVTRHLREGWEQGVGGRVIGITPSAVSAKELAKAGITGAVNSSEWGNAIERGHRMLTPRGGDLVLVDEAGMMSTDDLHRIVTEAQARGAKVVLIGDPAQLSAVGAGGALRLLVRDAESYQLDEVYRFREADGTTIRQWEADASLAVREGDASAVEQYRRHGRIYGGTQTEMTELIAKDYLIDVAAGRESVVLTGSNEQAEEVARQIRERLVLSQRVEQDGVLIWGGQQRAGKGDLIQARRNDHQRIDSQGEAVLNRYTYRVVDRHQEDGALTVRRFLGYDASGGDLLGGMIRLDAAYLQTDAVLAYAGTVHSAQGRTVQNGYVLLDERSARELVYVGMTRGWETNRAYVISTMEAESAEQPNDLRMEPDALMREAIGRDTAERSATETLAEAREWVVSGPPNVAEWSLIVEEHINGRGDALMRRLLSPENYARLQAEEPATVYRAARSAELRGHDFDAVLTEAVVGRELDTAETVAGTITWRMQRLVLPDREPEYVPATDWASRGPQIEGARGEYAGQIAGALDERQAVLGTRAAENPPEWAIERLGPVPDDAAERLEWERRAGAVAMYRETYGTPDDRTLIGRPPADGAVVQHAAWEAAWEALGPDENLRRLAGMSNQELTDAVATWQRYQEWAPRYVAEEMRTTALTEAALRRNAALARESGRLEPTPEAQDAAERHAAGLAALADAQAGRMQALEEIQGARDLYWERTTPVRENADAALGELARRGVELPTAAPAGPAAAASSASATASPKQAEAERGQEERERDAAQEAELDIDVEQEAEREREPEAEREQDQEQEREQDQAPEREQQPRGLDLDAELDRAREAVLRLALEGAPETAEGMEMRAEATGAELDPAEIERAEPELVEAEHGMSKGEMLEMTGPDLATPELELDMEM